MELLALLTRSSANAVFVSILMGALAGMGNAFLIPVMLASTSEDGQASEAVLQVGTLEIGNYRFALLYVAICLFILFTRSVSEVLLARVALNAAAELRKKIYTNIVRAPVAELESIGTARLLATITTDVQSIVMGATSVPGLLASLITVTGVLAYLFFLDPDAGWWVVCAIVVGVATYQIPMRIASRSFERRRHDIDRLYEAMRGLLHGTKELKLNQEKQRRFFDEILLHSEQAVLRESRRGHTALTLGLNYGGLLNFLVIGVVAFIFVRYHATTRDDTVAIIMSLLYVIGPIGVVLNAMTPIAAGTVSLRAVTRIFDNLLEEQVDTRSRELPAWSCVRLSGVTYTYKSEDRFSIGPVDLTLGRGEITFIVGGNGSGKSTVGKLVSLHYTPQSGTIYFDDMAVDRDNVTACRQSVAAIFSDFHLFDRLLDGFNPESIPRVEALLVELGLDQKVTVDAQGRFSTVALSDGQRKRLALLVAFLEDRDIYIFDEWAADQDPTFKRVFYERILPQLRARQKVVVVISHDDRYFHVADRVVVMEEGRIVRIDERAASTSRAHFA